ncbi:MAG: glutathionylspermidine synthase family protein [Planctomycetes bacterium]|nr:glutathionylspermidine synthase family protein [Planctomycetota bacterium]
MNSPLAVAPRFSSSEYAELRRRTIFECGKWDPQYEDGCVLAEFALVLTPEVRDELGELAEALAREALAAEAELAARPELHAELGLPRAIRSALREARELGLSPGVARVQRFDFHWTTDGWRISEVNSDVPGGFIEASGLSRLAAETLGLALAGDPTAALADALARATPPDGAIGLVHATAFTDDRQVMLHVARALEARGRRTCLLDPTQLDWLDGRASAATAWFAGPLDALARFFPAEWLPNLPASSRWRHFFRGARTPLSNPGASLLVQSKRFPLVWDELATPLPTWRALLPETRSPREVDWRANDAWLVKPALGRVGDGIGLRDVVAPREWRAIARSARWFPAHWAAQRRFAALPVEAGGEPLYPCLGVYVIDGRRAGIYGRIARRPLIDARAQDIAVLVNA